jgi:hypothetical protein
MRNILAGLLLLFGLASPALAQQVAPPEDTINCAFNTSPPTVSSGQMVRVQCNNAGQLIVSSGSASTPSLIDCSSISNVLCGLLNNILTGVTAPIPAGTAIIGYTSNDPCAYAKKTNVPFTTNGTSSVQLIALSGTTTIYVCSLHYITAGATTVAFTTGTGTACVTNNAAVIGSTTASVANSMSYAANGGETYGNGGATIAQGAAAGELCMVNGTNVYVSGNLTYVQQ